MKTIGHHVCEQTGGKVYVEENAPFKSEKRVDGTYTFLGEGFYYWDNDLKKAKVWGKKRYNNVYFIVESKLNIGPKYCFDLVGNRQHQIDFQGFIKMFKSKGYKVTEMATIIELLKDLTKTNPSLFPYKAIRVADFYKSSKKYYFNETEENYTDVDTRMIICLFEKNKLILQSKTIIYPKT